MAKVLATAIKVAQYTSTAACLAFLIVLAICVLQHAPLYTLGSAAGIAGCQGVLALMFKHLRTDEPEALPETELRT